MKKITLTCPEGFTYVSWQRVICTDENGHNVSEEVAAKLNRAVPDSAIYACPGTNNDPPLPACLFVESGESFGIEDFACHVEEELNCEVICVDGDR